MPNNEEKTDTNITSHLVEDLDIAFKTLSKALNRRKVNNL